MPNSNTSLAKNSMQCACTLTVGDGFFNSISTQNAKISLDLQLH